MESDRITKEVSERLAAWETDEKGSDDPRVTAVVLQKYHNTPQAPPPTICRSASDAAQNVATVFVMAAGGSLVGSIPLLIAITSPFYGNDNEAGDSLLLFVHFTGWP